jgi:hypothetical protein
MIKNNLGGGIGSNIYLIPTIDTGGNSRIPQKYSQTGGSQAI